MIKPNQNRLCQTFVLTEGKNTQAYFQCRNRPFHPGEYTSVYKIKVRRGNEQG